MRSFLKRLAAGVTLGVGAIFQSKVHPDDHWSTSPTIAILDEAGTDASGDPALT